MFRLAFSTVVGVESGLLLANRGVSCDLVGTGRRQIPAYDTIVTTVNLIFNQILASHTKLGIYNTISH